MIRLAPMTQADFEEYYPKSLQNLAEETAKAKNFSVDEMLPAARSCYERLLPGGNLNAPDQYLYNIFDEERKIGVLWFGVSRVCNAPAEAFVWEIFIEPLSIGKGFGKQAMLALEDEVRALGISSIFLNVFAHNERARALYENLGYREISSCMLKYLETRSGRCEND